MDDLLTQLSAAQKREIDDLNAAFKEVIASASGKRVLFWILEQTGVYRDAFVGSGENDATNYVLGKQSVGRMLISQMDMIDPRAYPRLLLEIADQKAMALAAAQPKEVEDDED